MNHPSFRASLDKLPAEAFVGEGVSFRPIGTEADLAYAIFDCHLTEEQQELVNPAGFSIGRAYLHPENNCPCLIVSDTDGPVGFINLCLWLGLGERVAFNWSYYIDARHQGRGFGYRAAQLAVRLLKAIDPDTAIKLSTEANNRKAQALYLSLGFRRLDELDGDDLVFGL